MSKSIQTLKIFTVDLLHFHVTATLPNCSFHKIGNSETYCVHFTYASNSSCMSCPSALFTPFLKPSFLFKPAPFRMLHYYTPYSRINHPFSYVFPRISRSLTAICCISINTASTLPSPVLSFATFYTIFSPPQQWTFGNVIITGMLHEEPCVISTTRAAGQVIDQWSLSSFILFLLSQAECSYCDSSDLLKTANK